METEEKDVVENVVNEENEDFVGGNTLDIEINVSKEGCIVALLVLAAALLLVYTIIVNIP